MSASSVIAWAVSLMVTWSPPEVKSPWTELRSETYDDTIARYVEIAEAIDVAAQIEGPLFSEKEGGHRRTMALLLSIAFFESRFHNRVTTQRGSDRLRSDRGRSWCAGQIWLGRSGSDLPWHYRNLVPEKWTGRELEADPVLCMRAAHRMIRNSMKTKCVHKLLWYTGEKRCKDAVKAMHRWDKAMRAPLGVEDAGAAVSSVGVGWDSPRTLRAGALVPTRN
jgi:hypothetical protein